MGNIEPSRSNRLDKPMLKSHYPSNYYRAVGKGSSKHLQSTYEKTALSSFSQHDLEQSDVIFPSRTQDGNRDFKLLDKSNIGECGPLQSTSQHDVNKLEEKCVCEKSYARNNMLKFAPFGYLSSRGKVQPQSTPPGVSSFSICPERHRAGNNVHLVHRQLDCKTALPPAEQTCSCEMSDEIPYEKNLALHYEKCTEKPPTYSTKPQSGQYIPRQENKEPQSEPSCFQVQSEFMESNYYEQVPSPTAEPSKSQVCCCPYPYEPSRGQTPCISNAPSHVVRSAMGNPQESFTDGASTKYQEESSRDETRCIASLPSYAPIQIRTCPHISQEEPAKECRCRLSNPSHAIFQAPPYQSSYQQSVGVSITSQPFYTPSTVNSSQQTTMHFRECPKERFGKPAGSTTKCSQTQKCPYCMCIEEQQQHSSSPTRSCQENASFSAPAVQCPQDSEHSSHGTTPCTYQTTDTDTHESQESSAKSSCKLYDTNIGRLSEEMFYSLSSGSSEPDLTLSDRKNRQPKRHRRHGQSESKAKNIVILQLLHEVVHLISDDESTKIHPTPVKRKIRNISAIGKDDVEEGAFISRTNLSSIEVTILPAQTGSTSASQLRTEGLEAAASQPAQNLELCYPINKSPCNLYIAPNLTCSDPSFNSKPKIDVVHGGMERPNSCDWNPGMETLNYETDRLQSNAEVICEPEIIEPEIIEPDDQCNCIEMISGTPCKERFSDKGQTHNCSNNNAFILDIKPNRHKVAVVGDNYFDPNDQQPKTSTQESSFIECCTLYEPPINQQPCDKKEPNIRKSEKDHSSDRFQSDDCFEPAVLRKINEATITTTKKSHQTTVVRLKPCLAPRTMNQGYTFSSAATTSSNETGDRDRRSNKLQFLSTTPIEARTEDEEPCDCANECQDDKEDCECHDQNGVHSDHHEQSKSELDECDIEIKKEKSREKDDCCDCCHCKAVRAQASANACNTIATPEQVMNDSGCTEMKYFIDSIIMDLDAMEAARRSKFGPQRSRLPSICQRQSFPVTIIDVTDLGSSSLYVKWCIHDCCGIGGYEIYVDGHLTNRYFHCNHEAAVICDVDVTEPHKVVLVAQTKLEDGSFEDFCNNRKDMKFDNKVDMMKEKCKTLLRKNDARNTTDSNKALSAVWTPSIYYYDPVNRSIPKPNLITC